MEPEYYRSHRELLIKEYLHQYFNEVIGYIPEIFDIKVFQSNKEDNYTIQVNTDTQIPKNDALPKIKESSPYRHLVEEIFELRVFEIPDYEDYEVPRYQHMLHIKLKDWECVEDFIKRNTESLIS